MAEPRSGHPWLLAVGLTVGLLLLAGCGGSADSATGEGEGGYTAAAVLDQPYTVPDTALTDTGGQRYSLAADTDKPLTLVFFGYTRCPDICHVVMGSLASAMTRLDEADRQQVDVVFVTTDPARDDEATLRDYLDRFDPSFIGLTGDLDTIVDVGADLAVAVDQGDKLPSGGYEVTHGTSVAAIDADDEVPMIWTQDTSAEQFAADVHHYLSTTGS
ncbi:SCO family protein [Nocardioides taihuensis]|uniref:SCO family protein n=1 Tax=Nocardioides taihuensis TaxID=1835606 RepID=A0ABW0BNZ1_9ACTN